MTCLKMFECVTVQEIIGKRWIKDFLKGGGGPKREGFAWKEGNKYPLRTKFVLFF